MSAQWARLTAWLAEHSAPVVTISWNTLDELVGGLPTSATKHYPQWWHGDRPNTRAWRAAGFELERADIGRSVAFRRHGIATAPAISAVVGGWLPRPPHTAPGGTPGRRRAYRGVAG